MVEMELRLECMKLACEICRGIAWADNAHIVRVADEFYQYISNGKTDPPKLKVA